MAVRYSDRDIEKLIKERKPLTNASISRLMTGHKVDVKGDDDNEFQLILRQNTNYPSNFSVILGVLPAKTTQLFRLCRYNSRHEHTNTIERETFYDFHIHTATERYQAIGAREDWYAESTDRFADFHTALKCMLNDCNFAIPEDSQLSLL